MFGDGNSFASKLPPPPPPDWDKLQAEAQEQARATGVLAPQGPLEANEAPSIGGWIKSLGTGIANVALEAARGEQIESQQRAMAFTDKPNAGPEIPTGEAAQQKFGLHKPVGWERTGELTGELGVNPATWLMPGSALAKTGYLGLSSGGMYGGAQAAEAAGLPRGAGEFLGGLIVPAAAERAVARMDERAATDALGLGKLGARQRPRGEPLGPEHDYTFPEPKLGERRALPPPAPTTIEHEPLAPQGPLASGRAEGPQAETPSRVYTTDELAGLTSTSILHPDFIPAGQRANVGESARELEARGQAALRRLGINTGRIEGPHPVGDQIIASALAHETAAAMARRGNASNWYTGNVNDAMEIARLIHPEIDTDPFGRMGYVAPLAITSQGERVLANAGITENVYDFYKRTGRYPTDLAESKQAPAMNMNFGKLNTLLDELGPQGTIDFLMGEMTVRGLKELGYKVGGENMDTMVYGSAIFGPKIGNGFLQNLMGNYNPATFDLWWMRMWGRLTGTLVGKTDISEQIERMQLALGTNAHDLEQLTDMARANVKQHERDFKEFRDEYNAKTRTKSELVNASQRLLHGRFGINQSPTSGGQRIWMRNMVEQARQILQRYYGIEITNADLQAILWYPEKDLYAKLGGKDAQPLNQSYVDAMRGIAAARGIILPPHLRAPQQGIILP